MRGTVIVVAIGAMLVLLAMARGTWRDRRIAFGGTLVAAGVLTGFGATGRLFPGGPAIGLEGQVWMLLAGWVFALTGAALLTWSLVRPRHHRGQHGGPGGASLAPRRSVPPGEA